MKLASTILLAISSCLLLISTSCNSSRKALHSGHYDQSIYKSVKKLRKNPNKEKHVLLLENAFEKAQSRDLGRINFLKKEGNPANWENILAVYRKIGKRQRLVHPLVPLKVESESRRASFDFVKVNEEIVQAKKNTAAFLYASAENLLVTEKKYKARQAFDLLLKVKDIYPNYRDIDDLLEKARRMGTSYFSFSLKNQTPLPLAPAMVERIHESVLKDIKHEWVAYIPNENQADYLVQFIVDGMLIGPEHLTEKHYTEEKKIKEGYTFTKDKEGKFILDEEGNKVKKDRYVQAKCQLLEVSQRKDCHIEGNVKIIDLQEKNVVGRFPVFSNAQFENYFATADGDLKALSKDQKKLTKNHFVPFPPDIDLMLQATDNLKTAIREVLSDHNELLVVN